MKLLLKDFTATIWHTKDIPDIENLLTSNITSGLSEQEAVERLSEIGPNELEEKKGGLLLRYLYHNSTIS